MSLVFDDIVSVAGKGGLFKILKPTKNGYVVEELHEKRKKIVLGPNHRVSLLKEISIYTTDGEGSVPLKDVYRIVLEKYNTELPVNPKDSSDDLFSFLSEILPNFDNERVYHSDVKKLISWYNLILKENPKMDFKEEEESAPEPEKAEKEEKKAPKKKSAKTKKEEK